MSKAEQIMKEWLELMEEENRKLDESHERLVQHHKEFMSECDRIQKGSKI